MTDGVVIWLTGLPASGKSTLAAQLATRLRALPRAVVVLDGDEVRDVLVPRPGHDAAARDGFYRSLAGLAALVARQGTVVVVAATTHRRVWRALARTLAPRFIEVHVATPLEECRRRDPKGLFRRAALLPELPGVGVDYEPPERPEVVAPAGGDARTVDDVMTLVGEEAARGLHALPGS